MCGFEVKYKYLNAFLKKWPLLKLFLKMDYFFCFFTLFYFTMDYFFKFYVWGLGLDLATNNRNFMVAVV